MKKAVAGLGIAVVMAMAQVPPPPPTGMEAPKAAGARQTTPPAPARKPAAPVSKTAASRPAATASYKDLKYPPMRAIVTPPMERLTLANGMRVFVVEDHDAALIHGMAVVRTGNLFDPRDRVGLAALTGLVMRTGGTRTRTAEQLTLLLENMAATLDSSIGESAGTVSFSGLEENADALLGAFQEVLTQPEFRQDKVEQARQQLRATILRGNEDAAFVLRREFTNTVYGKDTPYGWPLEFAGVDRITRGDLQTFYQRYYFPKNTMVAVWGDFDAAQMKAKIEKLFAGWTAEQAPVADFPKVSSAAAAGTFLVKKSEPTLTQFIMGSLGGDSRDRDLAALEVMAEALGGGATSRLGRRLTQETRGTALASWAASFDHPGLFQISGSVPASQTVKAVRAVRAETAGIRSAEVSDEELKAAKERVLDRLVYAFDTKAKAIERLLTYEYFGYPSDFTQQYQKALEGVTRADVLRVAKERVDPNKWALVVVGNPITFDEPLDRLGAPVTPIDLTMVAPKPAAALADEAARQRGKDLLARAQAAAGGAEKLAAVKDYTLEAGFQFDAGAGGIEVTKTDRWMAPSHFRQDSVMPSGEISVYIDGESGWITTPQGTGALAGTQLKQVQGDQFRAFFPMLLSDRTVGRAVKAVDDRTVEIGDKSGQVVRLVMDPETGLPRSALHDTATAAGEVAVTETYSDYREVGGLKLPFHISITAGGRNYAEATVKSFRANTGLQLKDLEKQP
ncbi:MAG: pitrilysin family protein [Bryobacteraceae bacterium]|jgi:zinc protease